MGRGRGKGKKQTLTGAGDDTVNGEDEKLPVRRRGRPQKPLKNDTEEEDEVEKIEENEGKETKSLVFNKGNSNLPVTENDRKRKRSSQVKENADDSVEKENVRTNSTDMTKFVGFRHNGSRRKNKPKRAAEVGVECV